MDSGAWVYGEPNWPVHSPCTVDRHSSPSPSARADSLRRANHRRSVAHRSRSPPAVAACRPTSPPPPPEATGSIIVAARASRHQARRPPWMLPPLHRPHYHRPPPSVATAAAGHPSPHALSTETSRPPLPSSIVGSRCPLLHHPRPPSPPRSERRLLPQPSAADLPAISAARRRSKPPLSHSRAPPSPLFPILPPNAATKWHPSSPSRCISSFASSIRHDRHHPRRRSHQIHQAAATLLLPPLNGPLSSSSSPAGSSIPTAGHVAAQSPRLAASSPMDATSMASPSLPLSPPCWTLAAGRDGHFSRA